MQKTQQLALAQVKQHARALNAALREAARRDIEVTIEVDHRPMGDLALWQIVGLDVTTFDVAGMGATRTIRVQRRDR